MATSVNNPTNSPPVKGQPVPFIRSASGKKTVQLEREKDGFNSGKDYQDEGAPLPTIDMESKVVPYRPYASFVNQFVLPPTLEEMKALTQPDETSQTQVYYHKEAVVMDVDAKLMISSVNQMRNGIFREAHYPSLIDYMNSPYYRKLRETKIQTELLASISKKSRLREAGEATIAGVRLNPRLIGLYNKVDKQIARRLRESGFVNEYKKLREDFFSQDGGNDSGVGQIGPNWDGGSSFNLAGREPDFTPLMAGPYNKQLYFFDYLDMHAKAFQAWTHNPIAKRIVKVIAQFVLGKGVKLTVMRALRRSEEQKQKQQTPNAGTLVALAQNISKGQVQQPQDWKAECQTILDRHWTKNSLHIRSKKILRSLLIFGEQFIRYFDAPYGLKLRQLDPSTIWEVVTDPDDAETEFYLHQQYPTRYQWFVDLPVPTIKFIIRQVPANQYFHMKINTVEGEVRGRSELFAILGWLRRLKEYATDRVVRNKMANLFVLDVAVEGDATAVQQVQQQLSGPPTPGSFFIHNKAAVMSGVSAEVGAGDTQGDWQMLLTIIAMGAGISNQYLGMGGDSGKAEALVGTEPDIKTFEDYQELMEEFFLQDGQRVFERAKERNEIPQDLSVTLEATYPALAEENRSEKLKDFAFGESMSWWSHRRTASAAAKEMQMTSYDYDQEQQEIATEDATKEFLINTAYQQVVKGADKAAASGSPSGGSGGGTSSGSSGKGASGMGMGKFGSGSSKSSSSSSTGESKQPDKEARRVVKIVKNALEESDEDTAPGTAFPSSSYATTHNASVGADGKKDPWAGGDPRDMAGRIKREAANLRYDRHAIGRREDRVQSPHKVRDQKSLDRGDLLTKAKRAAKRGNLNKESKPIMRFPREREDRRHL